MVLSLLPLPLSLSTTLIWNGSSVALPPLWCTLIEGHLVVEAVAGGVVQFAAELDLEHLGRARRSLPHSP